MPTMKAAFARAGAGIGGIEFREVAIPEPGPGEALVRLTAASVNFRDLLCLRGLVPAIKEPDYVPLSDATGEVIAVGADVTRVKPGNRVNPLFCQGWLSGPAPTMAMLGGPVDGVARSYGVFDAENLCIVPDEIGDLEAATLPCAGLTAWSAVFGPRQIKAGEWVLLQGTGGVSLAALQWSKAVGANVIITSSSDAKLNRARGLGADITINYRSNPDWPAVIRAALGGRGVDLVVDVVGAAELENCIRALEADGAISVIGRLEGEPSHIREGAVPMNRIVVGNREQHEAMLAFCARNAIRPVVDCVYDLDRLPAAMTRMEGGAFFGKIGINLL